MCLGEEIFFTALRNLMYIFQWESTAKVNGKQSIPIGHPEKNVDV